MTISKRFLQPIPFKANADSFGFTEAIESSTRMLNVMANDTGGGTLWSIADGNAAPGFQSALGAAVSIVGGKIAYNTAGLGDLDYLAAGQTITDTITYTIRSAAGAFSTATATITITGTNDKPIFFLAGTDASGASETPRPRSTSIAIAGNELSSKRS